MRTLLRAGMLCLSILSFHFVFSQQIAKSFSYSGSPDGVIGFLQFTPPDYGSQKHPLIIFLHGIGERGNGTSQINSVAANGTPNYCAHGATMRFTVNGITSSFVVLSPQLSTQYGYWPTFYVKELIKYAKANLQIDPNRIYVTGLSLGGGGVWRLITDTDNFDHTFDGTIAAAAPVCGTQEENDYDFCSTIGTNHLPVWAFHSMDDGTVGVGATQHAEILGNLCGNFNPAMKFTYYAYGGHAGAWLNAYDTGHITTLLSNGTNFTARPNLYEWFLSNTRSNITQTALPANTPPVVNAGAPQTVTLPVNLTTLSGSATGTNGSTIVAYAWSQLSGPSNANIIIPYLSTTLVTGLVQGTYVFALTAKDNNGLTTTSNVSIIVNPLVFFNQSPVASAGSDVTITLPNNAVTLDATGSYDPDGNIVNYHWLNLSGGNSTIADLNAAKTTISGLTQGTYAISLSVTDNNGASSYSKMTITVNPAPAVPSAPVPNQFPIVSAGSDVTITLPVNSVTLDATASYDPDGSIVNYHWLNLSGGSAVIADLNAAKTTISGLTQGLYKISLSVTDNAGASSFANLNITVNAATNTAPPVVTTGQPIGYIKQSYGLYQACDDASSSGRIPIYSSGIANGNLVYLDAAMTNIYNGGYNWFSFTATPGGAVTQAFSVFPDGTIHLLSACAGSTTPVTPPVTTPVSNLLGYIKLSYGPYQACDDASTFGRIPIYGTGIANGNFVYADAAMTQKYDGAWNWFSFTPVLGGPVTSAFAIYPIGSIGLLTNCSSGSRTATSSLSSVSVITGAVVLPAVKLGMYPNPVRTTATIELNSLENGAKTINIYNSNGVLAAKYTWQTIKGNNTFALKNIAGLPSGLYIADIRDSNGAPVGKLKFVKQ